MEKSIATKVQPADFKIDRVTYPRYRFNDLTAEAGDLISLIIYRLRISIQYGIHGYKGKQFYNPDDRRFYFATTIPKLTKELPFKSSVKTIQRLITKLNKTDYLKKNRKEHYMQLELPFLDGIIDKWLKSQNKERPMPVMAAKGQSVLLQKDNLSVKCKSKKQERNNSRHSNTLQKIKDFSQWKSTTIGFLMNKIKLSPKNALLLVDSIMKFHDNYNSHISPNKWFNVIMYQERNYWKKQASNTNTTVIHGETRLEKNFDFRHNIARDVSGAFAQIEANDNYNKRHQVNRTPNAHKNAISYMVGTLRDSFELWLDVELKTPKQAEKHKKQANETIIHTKNGVIKRDEPKWAKSNYHEKLHPTSKGLQKKIQKQLKDLGYPETKARNSNNTTLNDTQTQNTEKLDNAKDTDISTTNENKNSRESSYELNNAQSDRSISPNSKVGLYSDSQEAKNNENLPFPELEHEKVNS